MQQRIVKTAHQYLMDRGEKVHAYIFKLDISILEFVILVLHIKMYYMVSKQSNKT